MDLSRKLRLALTLFATLAFIAACGAQPSQEDEAEGAAEESSDGTDSAEVASSTTELPDDSPRNVIVMISDGMGYNHVDAASMYENGTSMYQEGQEAVASQVYQEFPVEVGTATYSLNGNGTGEEMSGPSEEGYDPAANEEDMLYVSETNEEPYDTYTDSAAAGTAMATGVKTNNDIISQTPDGQDLKTILESAAELDKATGLVTSVQISHATPAVFAAQNESRDSYDEIAQQMINDSPLDLLMGAGHPDFDNDSVERSDNFIKDYQYVGGEELWQQINDGEAGGDEPWSLVETGEDFEALAEGDTPQRVLGIPQVYETLQYNRRGDKKAAPGEVPYSEGVPTLETMTRGALNTLDNASDEGMFLMVEGGAVDWAGHANDLGRTIEEQSDFNRSVEAVNEWVEQNSSWDETLVIVTADHETGYLLGPNAGEEIDAADPLVNNGEGEMPDVGWYSPYHTNSLVPLYARGPGADRFEEAAVDEDPRYGPYMDNTEHGRVIFELYGDEPTQVSSGEE